MVKYYSELEQIDSHRHKYDRSNSATRDFSSTKRLFELYKEYESNCRTGLLNDCKTFSEEIDILSNQKIPKELDFEPKELPQTDIYEKNPIETYSDEEKENRQQFLEILLQQIESASLIESVFILRAAKAV